MNMTIITIRTQREGSLESAKSAISLGRDTFDWSFFRSTTSNIFVLVMILSWSGLHGLLGILWSILGWVFVTWSIRPLCISVKTNLIDKLRLDCLLSLKTSRWKKFIVYWKRVRKMRLNIKNKKYQNDLTVWFEFNMNLIMN